MEAISSLLKSGILTPIDAILLCVIGILVYFVFFKQKVNETDIVNTIEGMQTLLQEERQQTNALSKVVYQIRKEMENEKERNYALREEILILKTENSRLQNIVNQMEKLIEGYKEEIRILKMERGN